MAEKLCQMNERIHIIAGDLNLKLATGSRKHYICENVRCTCTHRGKYCSTVSTMEN